MDEQNPPIEIEGRKYRFWKREFLNLPSFHTVGFFYGYVSYTDASERWAGDVELTIGDCQRQISLSIELDSERNRANSLHKLNMLIENLTQLRDAFVVECDIQNEREAREKREREERKAKKEKESQAASDAQENLPAEPESHDN